jgi:hypothetical protein
LRIEALQDAVKIGVAVFFDAGAEASAKFFGALREVGQAVE